MVASARVGPGSVDKKTPDPSVLDTVVPDQVNSRRPGRRCNSEGCRGGTGVRCFISTVVGVGMKRYGWGGEEGAGGRRKGRGRGERGGERRKGRGKEQGAGGGERGRGRRKGRGEEEGAGGEEVGAGEGGRGGGEEVGAGSRR